jgi:hypothetical protein
MTLHLSRDGQGWVIDGLFKDKDNIHSEAFTRTKIQEIDTDLEIDNAMV